MALIRTQNYAIDGDKLVGIVKDEGGGWVLVDEGGATQIDADCAAELLAAIGPPPETTHETEAN